MCLCDQSSMVSAVMKHLGIMEVEHLPQARAEAILKRLGSVEKT